MSEMGPKTEAAARHGDVRFTHETGRGFRVYEVHALAHLARCETSVLAPYSKLGFAGKSRGCAEARGPVRCGSPTPNSLPGRPPAAPHQCVKTAYAAGLGVRFRTGGSAPKSPPSSATGGPRAPF
jgi:hypothetical protein